MTRPSEPTLPVPRLSSRADGPAFSFLNIRIAVAVLTGAILLAYANTFSAPFIFDDKLAITGNPSIREIGKSLLPSLSAAGANGRPRVNLSLAINYAIGGVNVTGYHIVNLIFHLAVTLVLFGLVRRTLELPILRDRFGAQRSLVIPHGFGLGRSSTVNRIGDFHRATKRVDGRPVLSVGVLWSGSGQRFSPANPMARCQLFCLHVGDAMQRGDGLGLATRGVLPSRFHQRFLACGLAEAQEIFPRSHAQLVTAYSFTHTINCGGGNVPPNLLHDK